MTRTRAAVYVRLSQQGEQEESIDRQIKLCSDYAIAHDWEPVIYREPKGARSGYYEKNRPAWLQLKKDLATRDDFAAVIVAELSRASRHTSKTLDFVEFCVNNEIQFVSIREQIDPSTALGRAFLGISAVFGQLERDNTSERKQIQYKARSKSIYSSNVSPFGLKRTGHYPDIVWTTTADFPAVILIAELYLQGYGAPSIAQELNKRGMKWINRKGERVSVTDSAITKALRVFERYAPFLDAHLFAAFLKHREQQRQMHRRTRKLVFAPFLLTGLLYCAHCGCRYHSVTQTIERRYGTYYYRRYRHRNMACILGNTFRDPAPIHEAVLTELAFLSEMSQTDKEDIARLIADPAPSVALDRKIQREKLLERLRGYEEMRADHEITRERFLQVKQEIEAELDALPEQVPDAPRITFDMALAVLDEILKVQDYDNRILKTIINKVVFDGERVTRLEYLPEYAPLERMVSEPTPP